MSKHIHKWKHVAEGVYDDHMEWYECMICGLRLQTHEEQVVRRLNATERLSGTIARLAAIVVIAALEDEDLEEEGIRIMFKDLGAYAVALGGE